MVKNPKIHQNLNFTNIPWGGSLSSNLTFFFGLKFVHKGEATTMHARSPSLAPTHPFARKSFLRKFWFFLDFWKVSMNGLVGIIF